jgi:predicted exporter
VTRRVWFAVTLWAVLLGGAGWYLAAEVHIQNDLPSLLPAGAGPTERLLLSELRQGTTGRLILLGMEGDDPDRLAAINKRLAKWMRDSRLFHYIGNGEQALTEEERDRLFRHRYELSPGVQAPAFTPAGLGAALQQRLDDLASPAAPMVKKFIPADPTGEFLRVLQAWTPWSAPAKHHGVWFSSDLRRSLLVAGTQSASFDVEAQAGIQRDIRAAFDRIAGEVPGRTPTKLVLAGPSVIAVDVQRTIEAEVWRLSIMATLLVAGFLYVSYRSFTLLVLSFVPLASGLLAGIVAVDLSFGFTHGITLAFGVTLLGVVDDYPIHLFSHLRRGSRAPEVMEEIWPTMRLGVLTTAIGFSALLLSGFPGLSQLGLFAIVGLAAGAGTTRWVLPYLVPSGFQVSPGNLTVARLFDRLRRWRALVPAVVLLAIGLLLWSDKPLWEQDIANLSPVSEQFKQLDQTLRLELGLPDVRDLIVVQGASEAEVIERSEAVAQSLDALVEKDLLGGYDVVSRYLPSRKTQEARLAALPDARTLDRNLREALKPLPFKPSMFEPFLADAASARSRPPMTRDTFRGTALALKLDSLLFSRDGRWVSLIPLRGVADRAGFGQAVTSWRRPEVSYLDLKEESNRLLAAYRNDMLTLVGWGAGAIALILLLGLRNPLTLLRVMAPIGGALLVVAAVEQGLGSRLSLFHLASFLLVIGLGLDYALFFNRRHGTPEERHRTVYGLLICSTTTILVFGVLASSQIPVLRAIGLTAALGSLACLLFASFLAGEVLDEA